MLFPYGKAEKQIFSAGGSMPRPYRAFPGDGPFEVYYERKPAALRQAFAYAVGSVGVVVSVGMGVGSGAAVSGGSVGLGSTWAMILSRDL